MSDDPKSVGLDAELHAYLVAHGSPPDAVLVDLAERTRDRFGDAARMQISAEQGALLTLLVRITGARRVVEVGTFTGYSSVCLARGLPEDGHLLCCDVDATFTALAREAWDAAGVADRVELRLGPAADTLRSLPTDRWIDLSFIDADKAGYATYFEELVARTRPGGLVCIDNVLWGGAVVDPADTSPDTEAIRAFNARVAADDRVEVVMLPVADGLTLARVR
ncbi:MAG TPA: class I SAM-dependent methyltransferase [Acidimicrobiales bacterium]|nr:class I SAM-dependent methyltransferase [Acidimicrobiales bacterium]